MVHRKNGDLRAELGATQVELQLVREERDTLRGLERELREELAQASRELKACAETLDRCRLERGEALDRLAGYGESEAMRAELDVFVGVAPMHTTAAYDAALSAHGMPNAELKERYILGPITLPTTGDATLIRVNGVDVVPMPAPESGVEFPMPEETRDDLNDSDDYSIGDL